MKDLNKTDDEQGGYDLIVLGAGSAGFSAAITGADAGKRVALVGHGTTLLPCFSDRTIFSFLETLAA